MAPPDPVPDSHRGFQASIIRFAVRFRGTVVALAFLLLGYGAISLLQAKYDVFPEFAPPQVGIQAEAPGLTAEQVEVLVTQPIENAVNGVPGVESLRSVSIQGLSVITIIFQANSDIYPRPPGRLRAARRGGAGAAAEHAAAHDHAADLLLEHRARPRPHLRQALADGPAHRSPTGRCVSGCSPCRASPRSPCSAATSALSRFRSAPTTVALQPVDR